MKPFEGKKLLFLGGNTETVPLVKIANELGAVTVVSSSNPESMAKACAAIKYDTDATDIAAMVAIAREEQVAGVLPGTDDIFVPAYCKVCDVLGLPCYANEEIIEVFGYKDTFKATCERYGIHGVPEYYLDASMNPRDLARIHYPVMVKPVDCYSGIGMTACYSEADLRPAVEKAIVASKSGRFIVEKLMNCDDVGLYYTFKDGVCSLSCIYDRYTGKERVALGNVYPSRHIGHYYERMHDNALRLFKAMGIKNGVLLVQAFYEDEEWVIEHPEKSIKLCILRDANIGRGENFKQIALADDDYNVGDDDRKYYYNLEDLFRRIMDNEDNFLSKETDFVGNYLKFDDKGYVTDFYYLGEIE